jgi:aspartate/methionine/tyrosine aminotransferase
MLRQISISEFIEEKSKLEQAYLEFKKRKLTLNLARGNPCEEQLALAMPMLDTLNSGSNCFDISGIDCRNFGELKGISEARRLFGEYMGVFPEEIFMAGSSSLTFMFQCIVNAMFAGVYGSKKPWNSYEKIKFLCPVPGYDRHFAMCEFLGIEMHNIPLSDNGPDMDLVERLVTQDETIKGIWCVPKYSNPSGCVYSGETVKRLANLKPAASDFRIFWDNAYNVHYVYEDIPLLNLLDECKEAGNPNIAYMFASTSKFTIPGAGVCFIAASKENIEFISGQMAAQSISWDKMNMLRHVRFLKDINGIMDLMVKHADILRPRFDATLNTLESELGGYGVGEWTYPKGGYFVTFKAKDGCAKRIVALCKEAGVILTEAGATHPYHRDPEDTYIRLAPSFPDVEEIHRAIHLFCIAAKLATIEKLIHNTI